MKFKLSLLYMYKYIEDKLLINMYRQGYLCTWTQKSNSIQSTCSTIVTKFSKRDLFPQTLLLSNAYLQSLVISPFCTESKWNLVSKNLNSTPSWIPNFIDFLYKMKEWWAIESKHFIIIILCEKVPFQKLGHNYWLPVY